MLETERLILRPWAMGDAPELYELAKNPNIGPRAGWPVHLDIEHSRDIIKNVLSLPETYAIVLKEEMRVIGSIGLMKSKHCAADEFEVGFWIGEPYWGRGIMPEAVNEILRYAFEKLHASVLWCAHFEQNLQSARVQEKCGFRYAFTRENIPVITANDIRTEIVNRMTREEWLAGITK